MSASATQGGHNQQQQSQGMGLMYSHQPPVSYHFNTGIYIYFILQRRDIREHKLCDKSIKAHLTESKVSVDLYSALS